MHARVNFRKKSYVTLFIKKKNYTIFTHDYVLGFSRKQTFLNLLFNTNLNTSLMRWKESCVIYVCLTHFSSELDDGKNFFTQDCEKNWLYGIQKSADIGWSIIAKCNIVRGGCVIITGTLHGTFVDHVWPICGPCVTHMWPICDPYVTHMWPICDLYVTHMWPICDLLGLMVKPCGAPWHDYLRTNVEKHPKVVRIDRETDEEERHSMREAISWKKIVCDPYVTLVFFIKNQSSYHFMHDYVLGFWENAFFCCLMRQLQDLLFASCTMSLGSFPTSTRVFCVLWVMCDILQMHTRWGYVVYYWNHPLMLHTFSNALQFKTFSVNSRSHKRKPSRMRHFGIAVFRRMLWQRFLNESALSKGVNSSLRGKEGILTP